MIIMVYMAFRTYFNKHRKTKQHMIIIIIITNGTHTKHTTKKDETSLMIIMV